MTDIVLDTTVAVALAGSPILYESFPETSPMRESSEVVIREANTKITNSGCSYCEKKKINKAFGLIRDALVKLLVTDEIKQGDKSKTEKLKQVCEKVLGYPIGKIKIPISENGHESIIEL